MGMIYVGDTVTKLEQLNALPPKTVLVPFDNDSDCSHRNAPIVKSNPRGGGKDYRLTGFSDNVFWSASSLLMGDFPEGFQVLWLNGDEAVEWTPPQVELKAGMHIKAAMVDELPVTTLFLKNICTYFCGHQKILNSRGQPVSGFHGTVEILYVPEGHMINADWVVRQ